MLYTIIALEGGLIGGQVVEYQDQVIKTESDAYTVELSCIRNAVVKRVPERVPYYATSCTRKFEGHRYRRLPPAPQCHASAYVTALDVERMRVVY